MKNKIKVIATRVIVSALLILAVGFVISNTEIVEAKTESYFVQISDDEANSSGTIWYDSRTGVQYWISNGVDNRGVCTPLIDETGKPLLYEPLRYDKKSGKSK